MDLLLAPAAFIPMGIVESFLSRSHPEEFFAYNFATGSVGGYLANRLAPVRTQKARDSNVSSMIAHDFDGNGLPSVTDKITSVVKGKYRRYHGAADDDGDCKNDILAEDGDVFDVVFNEESFWKPSGALPSRLMTVQSLLLLCSSCQILFGTPVPSSIMLNGVLFMKFNRHLTLLQNTGKN